MDVRTAAGGKSTSGGRALSRVTSLSFLSRVLAVWFKRDQPRTRLDEARVLEIARTAAAGQPHSELLTIVTLGEHAHKPTWSVSTATVGSSLVVTIDDDSGE